jgi:streptogramin lyase
MISPWRGGACCGIVHDVRELHTGDALAGYRIDSVIARGGMGVVYRATHLRLQRVDAIKVIAPELAGDKEFRNRFERESLVAARIDHPNVIPIYAAGEEDGLLYIAMRLVDGTDLRTLLLRESRIEPARAAHIVAAVAAALDAAHECGLVHRDVKPANVLLARARGSEHVYLSDFGLAKAITAAEGETKSGTFIGTTDYVSPEQVRGEPLDLRSDVYSLGCTLFHVLTGRVPYPHDFDAAKLVAHTREPVPSVRSVAPDVPSAFQPVLERAMAKRPADRYQSAGDLGRAALAAAEKDTASASRVGLAGAAPASAEATVVSATGLRGGLGDTFSLDVDPGARLGARAIVDHDPRAETAKRSSQRRPSSRRRIALTASGVALVIAAIVAAAVTVRGGSARRSSSSAGAVIAVGNAPDGIAIGHGSVWVANAGDGALTRIDEISGNVLGTISYANHSVIGAAVAVWRGSVWVADSSGDTVTRIDAGSGRPVGNPIRVGAGQKRIALSEDTLWVSNSADGTVTRIDAGRGRVLSTIRTGGHLGAITFAAGDIWVSDDARSAVTRIDGRSGALVGSPVQAGTGPKLLVVGYGSVWAANSSDGVVTRIDAGTGRVLGTTRVGGHLGRVTVAAGDVWVLDDHNDRVFRIDGHSGTVVGNPIHVGAGPTRIYPGTSALWVANSSDGTVTRIDSHTGRVLQTIRVVGYPDAIDVAHGIVWIACWSEPSVRYQGMPGTVVRIDENTGRIVST